MALEVLVSKEFKCFNKGFLVSRSDAPIVTDTMDDYMRYKRICFAICFEVQMPNAEVLETQVFLFLTVLVTPAQRKALEIARKN